MALALTDMTKPTQPKVFRYDGELGEFCNALDRGEVCECDSEMYWYFLEVLPPVFMGKMLGFPEKAHPMRYDFGFAEGDENVRLFYRSGERFFAVRSPFRNPYR